MQICPVTTLALQKSNQTTTINSKTLCDMFSQTFDKEALLSEIQLLKREC